MTLYPNSIDGYATLPTVAGVTDADTAINDLQAAVMAIENELGIDPHGVYSDVATRLAILESRTGPGPGYSPGSIDINTTTSGTLTLARGGTSLATVGAVNTAVTSTGSSLLYKLLDNSNVDAAAAIAGTKVAPNFGSQDIQTSGHLEVGTYVRAASLAPLSGIPAISLDSSSLVRMLAGETQNASTLDGYTSTKEEQLKTTDSSDHSIASFTIPNNSACIADLEIMGIKSDHTVMVWWKKTRAYLNDATVITAGTQRDVDSETVGAGTPTWTVAMSSASGGTIDINVNSQGDTVTWYVIRQALNIKPAI